MIFRIFGVKRFIYPVSDVNCRGRRSLNKNILTIGIIFLFIVSTISPIVFGMNVKTTDEEIQTYGSQNVAQTEHIWAMHKNDAQCTGRSPYDTSQNKGGEKWKYFIDSSIWGAVSIDKDGIIYVGSSFEGIHAVYPDGTKKWRIDIDREYQTPTIAPDGTIYVGTMKWFYAFYPNGTLKWTFDIKANYFCELAVDSNGTVYVGTQDGFVYAIYSNGTLKWEYYVADYIGSIALDQNENIYFCGPYTNSLFCMNPNGTLKWRYKKFDFSHGPVIGEDGTIYVVPIHWLVALYPNGTVKWIVDYLENDWYGFPSIAPDGTIIISGSCEFVTALNPTDGSMIWQYKIGEWAPTGHVSTPVIGGDGSVYFAYDAYSNSVAFLVALNPDGSLKWETSLTTDVHPYDGVSVLSDPSIGSDGTVYITSWFYRGGSNYTGVGYIHAIGMDNPKVPEPPIITGPSKVKLFTEYEYTLKSDLSGGGDVYYWIDWDDELDDVDDNNFWIGPFSSNEEVKVKHFWKIWGKHTIKVKAKGNDSLCSAYSYFDVKVGLFGSRESYNSNLLLRFFQQSPILREVLLRLL